MYVPASQAITGYLMYHLYAVLPASIPQEKENVHKEEKKVWTHLKVAVLNGLRV